MWFCDGMFLRVEVLVGRTKSRKCVKMTHVRLVFGFVGFQGFVVIVRGGCTKFEESEILICDIEIKLRLYFIKSWGFKGS